jgi:hypothetical protein
VTRGKVVDDEIETELELVGDVVPSKGRAASGSANP